MKKMILGFSAYISEFEKQKRFLEQFAGEKRLVFTSLHMPEEMNEAFVRQAKEMLDWLGTREFRIIGDISKRTLEQFNCKTIAELAKKLGLYMLRIDYGFSVEEIIEAGRDYPLAFNASTVTEQEADRIKKACKQMVAIHNFYPREYTGLSKRQFNEMNEKLAQKGIDVMAFVPCIKKSRGPIYAGLPTLEHQRETSTYVNFLELMQDKYLYGAILSDIGMDPLDAEMIKRYENEQVITIPVEFEELYKKINGSTYTIRIDSPDALLRLQESREFATPGESIQPFQCISRKRGYITCDNERYGRYSGEIQILKQELPMDARVNVVGCIGESYMGILDFIPNGYKIYFEDKNCSNNN